MLRKKTEWPDYQLFKEDTLPWSCFLS